MRIVWDEPKRLANINKHGLDFSLLGTEFFLTAIIKPSHSERRLALGRLEGRAVAVVFRPLGTEALSLISLRPARDDERRAIL